MSIESVQISDIQFNDLLLELKEIPSNKSPISGEIAVLCFRFMDDTGCRVTETIHVKKRDINFNNFILTVTNPKTEKKCKCSKWGWSESRTRKLLSVDKKCPICKGKGRWKKPQRTTFTNRIKKELLQYCETLDNDDYLFPISRQSLWKWGKRAGIHAKIDIFQQKEERLIEGIFLHLFRSRCAFRILKDAAQDNYKRELVICKLRHSSPTVTDLYTRIDINYLLGWEKKTYL
jgi:integrase